MNSADGLWLLKLRAEIGEDHFHLYLETNDTVASRPQESMWKRPRSTGGLGGSDTSIINTSISKLRTMQPEQPWRKGYSEDNGHTDDRLPPHDSLTLSTSQAGEPTKTRSPDVTRSHTRSSKAPWKCSQCGTTKTPQWRNGPLGLLCNFCGLLWLKRTGKSRSRSS